MNLETSSLAAFELLTKLTTRLASMASLDEITDVVSKEIAALGFGAIWIAVIDEPTGHIVTVRELIDGRDTTKEMPRISTLDVRQPIGHAFRDRRMVNIKHPESLLIIEEHPEGIPEGQMALPRVIFEHLRGHPFACGPLLGSRGQPVGAMGLSSYRGHEPLPDHVFDDGLLRAFMSHLGIAMERALHLQRLERTNSELLRTQELLMQESRMRAVGELAAAVAHDLNNLSGIVLMSLSSVKNENTHTMQVMSRAEGAIQAIGEMSRRLQRIARTGADPKAGAVDLKQVVEDIVALVRPLCREDSIELDLAEIRDRVTVQGDQTMVRQVVMNLVLNAREALIDVREENRLIELRVIRGDEEIALDIRDHGPGLPQGLADQMFKPFVSTKAGHAGLGLATVQASMKHFGGRVDAVNEPDGGARFRLTFSPATQTGIDSFQENVNALRRLSVLVVDDEPEFAAGLCDLLVEGGHNVSSAIDGDDAIAKVARNDFDLVLMDLGLPRRNGLEVVRALRGEGVKSKMVLMTGWDSETVEVDPRFAFCDSVLQKPFRRRDLDHILTALFGGPGQTDRASG